MNKSIFKKIKRSLLQSINQSPSSQEQIQFMSVQDMQKNLLTHINSSKNQNQYSQIVVNSQQSLQNKNTMHTESINLKNIEVEHSTIYKKVPDLMQQNDKLKDEIEKLKSQRKLILSQYENISTSSKINPEVITVIPQKSREFSFRKSVENVQRLISAQGKQKPIEKTNTLRQRQYGSIHGRNNNSSDSLRNQRKNSQRRNRSSQDSKMVGSHMRSTGSKEVFSTLQERFYQYCKNEMVKMNSDNANLTLKIVQLESKISALNQKNQLLSKQNTNLQALTQALQQKLQLQNQKILKISEEMSTTLIKKQQLVQQELNILKSQLDEFRKNEQKLKKQIQSKDVQITILKTEISQKQKQQKNQFQLITQNAILQSQVNQLVIRNKKANQKFRKMPVIDHLWEIKEVQYENLINLIQHQKQQLQTYNKLKNSKINSISTNALDLTFSKNRSYNH